jgi:homoserine O-acetyltransferase/O-succinyltransferase
MRLTLATILIFGISTTSIGAADFPKPEEGDYILKDVNFASGETMPEVRMHYRTVGQPKRDDSGKVTNAVLVLHATGGQSANFVEGAGKASFAGELFGAGQPLDAMKYWIIIPDSIGHGKSSKPSDGMHAHFPAYAYHDNIHAQHRLLTEGLKVDHVRLVMGTSMGGMHTWLWAEMYPDFMDALVPLASLPGQISGRNRMWRKMISELIRTDPEWMNGDYKSQPHNLRFAIETMYLVGSNPVLRQKQAPTLKAADESFGRAVDSQLARTDANDLLYAVESSKDYDPAPDLEKIRAPLLAINFGDDLINPPELGILEREIKRVPKGRAIVFPLSDQTVGHGTHTKASVWKSDFERFLKESAHFE